eukprot:PhF_6_TR2354/c0_g1_i1/m.4222
MDQSDAAAPRTPHHTSGLVRCTIIDATDECPKNSYVHYIAITADGEGTSKWHTRAADIVTDTNAANVIHKWQDAFSQSVVGVGCGHQGGSENNSSGLCARIRSRWTGWIC